MSGELDAPVRCQIRRRTVLHACSADGCESEECGSDASVGEFLDGVCGLFFGFAQSNDEVCGDVVSEDCDGFAEKSVRALPRVWSVGCFAFGSTEQLRGCGVYGDADSVCACAAELPDVFCGLGLTRD